jgi:hypothetical protein
MTARAARDVINNVINVTGIVEARSARIENGEIVIDGGENGTTVVAGRLDVSGNEADAKGGNVTVLGGRVELAAGTDIRASGEAGGGTVLVGGGQHGQGTAYNAQTLYMDAAAVIDANATLNGNGGKVVLWADDTARVEGSISARGGTIAGDGGFVETSGKNRISFADTVAVDTRAFNGRDGSLLIDPTDFTIASSGGDITAAVLLGMLTTSDITIDSATGASGTLGNINVNDAIVYTGVSTRTLTLNAMGSININAGISASILNINLVLQADGNVNIAAAINTNNGYITTAGYNGAGALGGNFTTTAAISLSNAALTLNTAGAIALNGTVTTTGTVTLNAGGPVTQTYAISGGAGLVLGGTGAITLNESGNNFAHITLNRAGTSTNVSLVTSATPIVHASSLGTGSFSLSGLGFVQTGSIVQDALADSFTINGGLGNVTLSQANTFTGDVTLLAGTISVTNDQSFDIDSSAVLNLLSNGDISISRNLVATGPGSMSMIFNARYSGGSFGSINIRPTTYDISIDTHGGYIVMGGGSGGLTNALPSAAQAAIGGGIIDQGISIRGYDSAGTPLGVTINTGGGNFFARGTGAAGGTASAGVALNSTAGGGWVTIETGAGNINIHGTGGTGSNGDGVLLQGDSAINAATLQTTSGSITITGISGTGGDSNGINAGDYSEILTTSGMLTLNGTSTGSGYSRGVLATGMIDAGTAGGSTITGMSLNEYGVRLGPTTDWRVGNGGTLSVMGTGTSGVGIDGSSFTLDDGSLIVTGEGTSGQGINLSGAITYDGAYGLLQFNGVGAYGDIVLSGTIDSIGNVDLRTLELQSSGNIDLQGTPAATVISATPSGALVFLAHAAETLDLDGKIISEGGAVSLIGGKTVTLNAGIETFGGDITIWGNAAGGTPSVTPSSGVNIGVNLQRTSASTVTLDAGGGNISIAGAGGDGGNYSHGVLIDGVAVETSGTGAITVLGRAGASASGAGQVGVYINGDISLSTAYSTGTALVSGTGGITLTGYGGASGSGGTNIGVRIARATLTATGGDLSVVGTGGAGSNSHSIEIAGADILATGAGGDISLQGATPIGTGTGISLRDSYDGASTSVTIGGASFQGDLSLRANTLSTTATTLTLSHQAGGGTITFRPETDSTIIGVSGGSGALQVTSAILSAISGFATQAFGSTTQSGAINIGGASTTTLARDTTVSVNGAGVYLASGAGALALGGYTLTVNSITGNVQQSGDINGTGTLVFSGGGDVALSNAGNAFSNVALDKTGAAGNVNIVTGSALSLGASTMGSGTLTLNAATGIAQTGALVQDANGGNVTMSSTGAIILSQANEFTGSTISIQGGSIQITAQQDFTRTVAQIVNLTSTAGNVLVGGDLVKSSGTGGAAFNIDASETAWFANAGIQSDGGNIRIWGNAPGGDNNAGTNAGTAWGVQINGANAILSSGSGNINIVGKGSTDSGTGQHGIVVWNGGSIESTSGNITLTGRGGDGSGAGAQGIVLAGGSQIETQSGVIELYGYGGAHPSSANAHGISLDSGASIVNTGATYVLLNGTGANGGKGLIAVGASSIAANASTITLISNNGIAMDGTVLTATGGANFTGGAGNVALNNASNDIAGSIGFTTLVGDVSFNSAGAVTIGATSVNGNLAVASFGAIGQSAAIQVTGASDFTADGAITLTNAGNMFGGAVSLTNSGGGFDASISATGTLTLDAIDTEGHFTAQTQGYLGYSNSNGFAAGKNVTLTATGANAEINVSGGMSLSGGAVTIDSARGVQITGNISTSGGAVSIQGQGSTAGAYAGVAVSGATIDAGGGDITLSGTGGDSATGGQYGIIVSAATLTTSGSGDINLTGSGGTGSTGAGNLGVYVNAGSNVFTANGALTVIGTGGGTGGSYHNIGVSVEGAQIRSTGTGGVSVTGTGGLEGNGVIVTTTGGAIRTVDGTLTVTGTGTGARSGVEMTNYAGNGVIESTGLGNVTVTGTGGGSAGPNVHGIYLDGPAAIRSVSGALTLDGHATYGTGVVTSGAGWTIGGASATGAIALDADTISLSGTGAVVTQGGGFTADATDGLTIASGISTGGGNINLYGNAPGGGAFGSSSVATFGVSIDGASAVVDAGGGDIAIKGAGGTAGSHGVTIRNGAGVLTSGAGTLTIEGQGGNGGSGSAGVEFYASGAYAQTQHGALTVTGTGGTSGSGNTGVALATGNIRAVGAGSVTVTGTGGGLASVGVHVGGGGPTEISAVDGTITITATGGGANSGGNQSHGLEVALSGQQGYITTSGVGDIVINATAGGTAGDNDRYGMIVRTGGFVAPQFASVSITAAGGTGGGTNNHAFYLDGGILNSSGALTLSTTSGDIVQQTGSVTVGGNTSLTTTNGNIDWAQTNGMTIGSIVSSGTLNVSVTSGSISQVGAATVAGTASFTADGNIALTNASNAFGGALSLTATNGSASVTNSGALILGDVTVGGALTVTAGGALTQLGASFFSAGSTSLSATGAMTLTESGNDFGTSLSLTGTGGTLDGTASTVTASSGSFTFNGAPVANSAPPTATPTQGETTNTVTTETLAQIITQILTSTVVQPSSTTTGTTDAANVNPVSPAAVQAMLIAILAEAASPAAGGTGGGQQGSGEGNNPQTAGGTPQTGGAQSGTPTPAAGAGTFAAGTTITINTSGGAVQSITVTPVGGGAPVTILPGLLNLTPPAIPTATATGTPGISGNFPLAWGGR